MGKNAKARAIIKELALQAKQRMKNSSYGTKEENLETKKFDRRNCLLLLSNKECKKPEITIKIINDTVDDENFKNRVYAMLQENKDTSNPMAKLIDQQAFDSMDEFKREKYILDISDKYLKIRENYMQSYSGY